MSATTRIRRQGSAAVITIPASVMKRLHAGIGDELALEIAGDTFRMRRLRTPAKRYKLSDLLVGSDVVSALNADAAWVMEGDPVGREIS